MSEGLLVVIVFLIYYVLVCLPTVGVYINRGRQTGKVGPKLSATVIAMTLFGIPAIGLWIYSGIKNGVWLTLEPWGLVIIMILILWLGAYAGPLGAGWMGKWDHYAYPQKRKGVRESPTRTAKIVAGNNGKLPHLVRSWRVFTGAIVMGEIVIFVGGGIIFSIGFLTIIGIGLAVIHIIVFLAIWHGRQQHLQAQGWRW